MAWRGETGMGIFEFIVWAQKDFFGCRKANFLCFQDAEEDREETAKFENWGKSVLNVEVEMKNCTELPPFLSPKNAGIAGGQMWSRPRDSGS